MGRIESEPLKRTLIEEIFRERAINFPTEPVGLAEIARDVDTSREWVRRVYEGLVEEGKKVPPKSSRGRTSPEERIKIRQRCEKVKKLWDEGLTLSEIAEGLEISRSAVGHYVYAHLRQSGEIGYRSLVNVPAKEKEEEVKPLFKEGATYEQIKGKTGLSRSQTEHLIKKLQERGELDRRRKRRRNPGEIKEFDAQVEGLRNKGLSKSEIATRLEDSFPKITVFDVANSFNRLLRQRRIERRR